MINRNTRDKRKRQRTGRKKKGYRNKRQGIDTKGRTGQGPRDKGQGTKG